MLLQTMEGQLGLVVNEDFKGLKKIHDFRLTHETTKKLEAPNVSHKLLAGAADIL